MVLFLAEVLVTLHKCTLLRHYETRKIFHFTGLRCAVNYTTVQLFSIIYT